MACLAPNGAADKLRRAGKPQDDSQPRHHLLHPLLADVGVNLGGGDGLMTEQGLDVHQLGPGVEQIGRVSMAQLVGRNLLVDVRLTEHPPQGRPAPPARTPVSAPPRGRTRTRPGAGP